MSRTITKLKDGDSGYVEGKNTYAITDTIETSQTSIIAIEDLDAHIAGIQQLKLGYAAKLDAQVADLNAQKALLLASDNT